MLINGMLAELEQEAFEDHKNDAQYKRIRVDIIQLLAKAQETFPEEDFPEFKSQVMYVFHQICGTHMDLDVLENHKPDILSNDASKAIV